MTLKEDLTAAMKDAMRSKQKERLTTVRMVLAAIKQQEIDGGTANDRPELDDAQTLAVVEKLLKRSRDSLSQYEEAGREDLAAKERADIEVYQEFMPQQMSPEEISAAVDSAIAESGAESMQDMGKVMKILKPALQGKADMGSVSGIVRGKLA